MLELIENFESSTLYTGKDALISLKVVWSLNYLYF